MRRPLGHQASAGTSSNGGKAAEGRHFAASSAALLHCHTRRPACSRILGGTLPKRLELWQLAIGVGLRFKRGAFQASWTREDGRAARVGRRNRGTIAQSAPELSLRPLTKAAGF